MKKFILLGVVAGALAFTAGSTEASNLVITVSGTAEIQKTNETTSTALIGTTSSSSFSNKQIYTIISNALANASGWSGGAIASTNVPANGYIVFNPGNSDGLVEGTFYVTNKSGVYWPLSGFDANGEYFSWVELDTQCTNYFDFNSDDNIQFGFVNDSIVAQISVPGAPFGGIASYKISNSGKNAGQGSATLTATGLLYFHDDPYCYDDADDPDIFWSNYLAQGDFDDAVGQNSSAVEIRGILTASLTIGSSKDPDKAYDISSGTISLTGMGNLAYENVYGFLVTSGKATFAQ